MEGKKEEHGHEVKCSFCGNDTSCDRCKAEPASAAGSEHICYDCYQKMAGQLPENIRDRTHICIPPEKAQENFERFLNETTERAFVQLWDTEKKNLKEMSRQGLSRASFFEGARFMFSFMQQMSQEEQKHEHDEAGEHEGKTHKHDEKCEHGHEHDEAGEHKHGEKKHKHEEKK